MNRLSHSNKPRPAEVLRHSARKGSLEANTLESIYELYDEAVVDREEGTGRSGGFLLEQREYNPRLSGDGQDSVGFQSQSSFRNLTPGPYAMSVVAGEQHSVLAERIAPREPRFSESNGMVPQQQRPKYDSQRKRLLSSDASNSPVETSRIPNSRKTAQPDFQYYPDPKFILVTQEPRATTSSQEVSIDYPLNLQNRDTWAAESLEGKMAQPAPMDSLHAARLKLAKARDLKARMQGGDDILAKYTLSRLRMM